MIEPKKLSLDHFDSLLESARSVILYEEDFLSRFQKDMQD